MGPLDIQYLTECTARTRTPFVNRKRELVELALLNACFVYHARTPDAIEIPNNWRNLHFVYAAQMYGAGKTRIGSEFVKQTRVLLKEDVYHKYCPVYLKPYLPELLPILKTFSGARELNVITCLENRILLSL